MAARRQKRELQVRVAGAQHCGEAGGLFFASAPLTGFFKMPVVAHNF